MEDKDKSKVNEGDGDGGVESDDSVVIVDDEEMRRQMDLTSKDYYFDSYAHFGIHEEMLKDRVRTDSYRKAILFNKHVFKDKIVLDVGCGTGILSMFAARAGAKKVFAVDLSTIVHQAKQIVKDNNLSEQIEVIHAKMEDVKLPVDKVDIIISEWMGYFLLYESMLDTVLLARDKWLKPGVGMMFPNKSSMYICGIEDAEYMSQKFDFWDDVYGFNMSCMKRLAFIEPLVEEVSNDNVCTTTQRFVNFDLEKMKGEEVDFNKSFSIHFTEDNYLHALVVYFDVEFSHCHTPVQFATGPGNKYTHWRQTIFYLPEAIVGCSGEEFKGRIKCKRNQLNTRDLDIEITYEFFGVNQKTTNKVLYRLR